MKITLKRTIATTKIADSTAIKSLYVDLQARRFVVVYKSSDAEYMYGYNDDDSKFVSMLSLMSIADSAGKFVAELKSSAPSVWKRSPWQSVGVPIKI